MDVERSGGGDGGGDCRNDWLESGQLLLELGRTRRARILRGLVWMGSGRIGMSPGRSCEARQRRPSVAASSS